MKKLITNSLALFVLFFIGVFNVNAQTLPTAVTLPLNETFSTLPYATGYSNGSAWTLIPEFNIWKIANAITATYATTAPTTTTRPLTASASAATTTSGALNYNGYIGWISSSAADLALACAINTTGITGVGVSYEMSTIRIPDATHQLKCQLQYSLTANGTFTAVANSEYLTATSPVSTTGTTKQGTTTVSVTLPAACNNQSVVYLRWVDAYVTNVPSSSTAPSFAIANVVIGPSCISPGISSQSTAAQSIGQGATPTALTVAATGTGLSYQWYSNSTASNTGGTSLAPAGQANSFTPPTTTIGTTYYYCVVTGTCGSATSSASGAITVTAPVPTVSLTSGANPAAATYNIAITPVVYGYVNVNNDADVTASWYSDNTYTTPTTAPAGLSLDLNATTKTMTLSGTPSAIGTFYYSVVVNETNGNSINGSIVVSPPPAPVISGGANTNTSVQPGVAPITNIVYTLTNSTGASVSGLPLGLSGSYSAGTYTISGTVDASVTPGSYAFTVTATAMAGYSGAAVTAAGTVLVKSATAKQLLYLTAAATPSANDTRLYPMLNNSTNYIVTVKLAAATAPGASAYSAYDVIVLNESVASANAEAVALKGIDKPILNLKNFVYGVTTPTPAKWAWAQAPDNGKANNGTVTIKQASHPIFTTPTNLSVGATLDLLSGAATKGIQPTDVTLLGSICVATAPLNASPYNPAIAIHDVPATVRAANTGNTITSKYIMIPICNDSYNTMTDAALTLINNALDYLLNATQFTAPSLAISGFNVGVDATIDNTANTITAVLPISTDLTSLQPTITLAGTGTSVSPASTVATNFSNSYYTAVNYTVSDGINSKVYAVKIYVQGTGLSENKISGVSFDGLTIHNDANLQLQVYNTLGSLMLSSNKNINMTNYNKGVYIVKSANESLKISILK